MIIWSEAERGSRVGEGRPRGLGGGRRERGGGGKNEGGKVTERENIEAGEEIEMGVRRSSLIYIS